MPDSFEDLSAYLDDELDAGERAAVDALLARSPEARAELDELAETRRLLRSLPAVTPRRPLVVAADPVAATMQGRSRTRLRRLASATLAAAAVWLVVLSVGVSVGELPVVPDIAQLRAQHASAAPLDGFAPMSSEELDDPAVLADIGHDMVLSGLFQREDLVHARYSDGVHVVSVFHQPGEVDWDAMEGDGQVTMMPEGAVWTGEIDGNDVVVTERGDLVVTIIADDAVGSDMAMAVSEMVPPMEMRESLWSRLRKAPSNLLDRL
jgi:hypothetical protein